MKILLTGTSSGIGEALAQKLKEQKHTVWGISRRKTPHSTIQQDLSKFAAWEKILKIMKGKKFKPDVVVFNAAIQLNDLNPQFNPKITKKMFDLNFFSILEGINLLIPYLKKNAHFIVISSTSSFKGSAKEGIGYASSKAAISLAFEGLYEHFKDKYLFSTIYFGPVQTEMRKGRRNPPMTLLEQEAALAIIETIKNRKIISYYPKVAFLAVKFIKLLPKNLHLKIFPYLEDNFG